MSVIVPNYNHASFLKQRVDSILNQTYQDFELIILDDCSTDNSREIIETHRNNSKIRHIVYNDQNSGSPFKQWQKGIELAKGEFIWIAESDDWCEATFLEEMIPLLKDESIGLCFCGSNWVDDTGCIKKDLSMYKESFRRKGKLEIINTLVKYNSIQNASAVLIRCELAKKNLNKISQFKACGDWLFYVNILQDSDMIFNDRKLNNFRWYHNNTSNMAEKSGLWIKEGLDVLALSKAYKVKFSLQQLQVLRNFWKFKIGNSKHLSNTFCWLYYKRMSTFILKNLIFNLLKF